MTTGSKTRSDFRAATESKKAPKAAVDGVAGMILAFAEVSGTPDMRSERSPLTRWKHGGRSLVASARGCAQSPRAAAARRKAGRRGSTGAVFQLDAPQAVERDAQVLVAEYLQQRHPLGMRDSRPASAFLSTDSRGTRL